MLFSMVGNERRRAFRGATGTCSNCGSPTVAKCGPKIVWHWAHQGRRHCDPWWENETPWHAKWKTSFPIENQEVVHHDEHTGEKHVADVKTNRGLVIELQNSPMPLAELRSREAFYGHMVWVVNGALFARQFFVLDALPDPKTEFAADLVFHRAHRAHEGRGFWRKSENLTGGPLVLAHSMSEIREEIARNFAGHHLFDWERPRTVWFDATAPVFLDFGDDELLWLKRYDDRDLWCVQRVSKRRFVTKNGGTWPSE
jgi:competence CoiA-like predicted nuclease